MRWYRAAHMWAFDLIELDGADMRREPLAQRKASLERVLAPAEPGLRFNEHHDRNIEASCKSCFEVYPSAYLAGLAREISD
jgi:ATP-dependent DNA ligase